MKTKCVLLCISMINPMHIYLHSIILWGRHSSLSVNVSIMFWRPFQSFLGVIVGIGQLIYIVDDLVLKHQKEHNYKISN